MHFSSLALTNMIYDKRLGLHNLYGEQGQKITMHREFRSRLKST